MHAEIDKVFSTLKTAEVIERLEAADIANARLNDMSAVLASTRSSRRAGAGRRSARPRARSTCCKPPFNLSGFEPRMDAVPALGEHSRAILRELGYTDAELIALPRTRRSDWLPRCAARRGDGHG